MKNLRSRLLVSPVVYVIFFVLMLVFSGLYVGMIAFMVRHGLGRALVIAATIVYWLALSLAWVLLSRIYIRTRYETATRRLADGMKRVTEGDLSVYVPTVHTSDRLDYLDQMILDFDKMVEELGSIETLKTDFFSNVSHEIKTPLAVIQSNAELLEKPDITPEQREECVAAIRSSTRRLTELISNMLKLNRLEKQVIEPQAAEFDICAQISECALQFEELCENKGIEMEAFMEDRRRVSADPGLMELVWTNLISNAVKFTPSGGTVKILESFEDGTVSVTVEDNGIGMDAGTMKHIFDKFYQGDLSHSTEGNGLGLALVDRILDIQGCTIEVRSEPGKGSAFTVRMPTGEQDQ